MIGHEEAHGLDVSGCESWGEGNAVLTGDDEGLRVPCEDCSQQWVRGLCQVL